MTFGIGSLCSGYGGLETAVQAVLGGELTWVADPDPGAAAILKHHHPDVPNLGDITKTKWEDVARVDLLCGGYPCQPFSSAGLQKGVEDERHIWPYIATALRVLRPRYALFENVANHLRIGFDVVLADLAALGFDVEWCTVRASDIGAPHSRRRLIFLATAADACSLESQRWGGAGLLGSTASAEPREGDQRERAGDAALDSSTSTSDAPSDRRNEGRPEPARLIRRPDAALGSHATAANAPSVSGPDEQGSSNRSISIVTESRAGDGTGSGNPPAGTEQPGRSSGIVAWGVYESAIRRWERVLGRPAPRPTEPGRNGERLSPAFTEWLMGLPAGHVTAVPALSRNQQLKALGNGVVPQQAIAALQILLERRAAA